MINYTRYNAYCIRILLIVFLIPVWYLSLLSQTIQVSNGNNGLVIKSNTYNELRLSYSLSTFKVINVNTPKGVFSKLVIDNYTDSYNTGYPSLPLLRKLIEVPVNAKITVNIISSESEELSLNDLGIYNQLLPSQPHISKDTTKVRPAFQYNTKAYLTDDFYSPFSTLNSQFSSPVTVNYLGMMRSVNIARVNISPFSYNPVSGKIKVLTKIEIQIDFENPNIGQTLKLKQINSSPYFAAAYKSIFNYKQPNLKEYIVQSPVNYVIVSDPMFRDSLQSFIKWKTRKGFRVIEVYTDNPLVGKTADSIKKYLRTLYYSATLTNPPPSFILFVGDIIQIPSFRGTGSQNYYHTDLPYCEYTGDYFPEVYYGRFSANNVSELMPQIHKTMEYEQYLMPDPSYLNYAILIAGYDSEYSWLYANGQINYAFANYFNAAHGFNTFVTKYPNCSSQSSNIKQRINTGAGFVNYTAHGAHGGWENPSLNKTDVGNMTNIHKYPLMVGNACYTQFFSDPSCFGETLLRAKDKGALGYVGAYSETYWDEDFWWSVGFCNIDTFPKYGFPKSLGAYDRLFHTHGESYDDWYITQGQIQFGGNLSVTQSGSPYADYYWENYSLMGDPSLTVYLTQPSPLKIQYNRSVPAAINEVNFITEPFTYIAISHNDTLLGAALADSNGLANVNVHLLSSILHCSVVATKQNRIPYFDTISFLSSGSSYIILNSKKLNKTVGTNDGKADYGDYINLDVTLKNIGSASAQDVKATLTTDDKFITLHDTSNTWGNINSKDSLTILNAFTFSVDSIVPDQHSAAFKLTISDKAGTKWTSWFNIKLNSPAFKFNNYKINEGTKGNRNDKLEPGETADIIIPTINNGHTVAESALGELCTLNDHITINKYKVSLGDLKPDSSAYPAFNITADKDIIAGTPVQFTYLAISGSYIYTKIFTIVVGSAVENYETNNFSKYKWNDDALHPWVISDTLSYKGTYTAHSAYFSGTGSSVLSISFNVNQNDTISFYKKINANPGGNFLQFYIDDTIPAQWTGKIDWSRSAFHVAPGYHTFKWVFVRYSADDSKYDCAWLDDISFPSSTDLVINEIPTVDSGDNGVRLSCYPNPFSGSINISFSLQLPASSLSLILYDYLGQEKLIILKTSSFKLPASSFQFNPDLSSFSPGFYFLRLYVNNNSFTKKIIKLR
jgi:hypothetical protein